MVRLTVYFLLGLLCMLLQTTIVPWLVPTPFKPDLMLVLILYISLCESIERGCCLSFVMGSLHDVFAGSYLGLYGLVYLLLFLLAKATMRWFDTESVVLLLALVFFGTLLKGGIVLFVLIVFAEAGTVWPIILKSVATQACASLLAAIGLLAVVSQLQKRFSLRWRIPVLQGQDNDNGF